jgi:hypothetical protein
LTAITVLPQSTASELAQKPAIRRQPPDNDRDPIVTRHSSPIDNRPFQPKAKLERQQALVDQYRDVGIQDVAEALHHMKLREDDEGPAALASAA